MDLSAFESSVFLAVSPAQSETRAIDNFVVPPTTGTNQNIQLPPTPQRPAHAKEYHFLDIELKYGFLQVRALHMQTSISKLVEALSYLHYSGHVIHRNVCPSSILVTKRGTWKLAGLEFIERMNETDLNDSIPCQPWSSRVSKMAQPNLDFMAPETQITSKCSLLSDMFSLGLVICAVFNNGRPIIQAGNSASNYMKQLETLDESVQKMLPRVPVPLQEATSRLVSRDPTARPPAQLLQLIKYFVQQTIESTATSTTTATATATTLTLTMKTAMAMANV
ncbi:SCY1-like protein 2 [Teleopsis dalmanni]|uniref:SCY1-like protein 2 n=1 Tax=Teleopsis dalmanni TaxID=139649 RepID=UPI0018CDED77|nr:SCY1-like protein 2 [Teleopsis dalmanni]